MSYDNTNRIALWTNENKQKDTHPDYTGSLNVDGVEYFVDVWDRKQDAKETAPLFSGTVKKKDVQPGTNEKPAEKKQPEQRTQDLDDSDIPF